jgi:hypothetical protein
MLGVTGNVVKSSQPHSQVRKGGSPTLWIFVCFVVLFFL